MKILRVELGTLAMPLKKPFKTALRMVTEACDVVICLRTDTGLVGFGSAAPTPAITGETTESILGVLTHICQPLLVGLQSDEFWSLRHRLARMLAHNTSALAALDMALFDLEAQSAGMALHTFLGAHCSSLTSDLTISVGDPAQMAADALEAVQERGFGILKIKLGLEPEHDVARVKAIRAAVGPGVTLRLDANQGWAPKEAVRIIHTLEDAGVGLDLVEQPVRAADVKGLRYVTSRVATEVAADEAVMTPQDAVRVLSEGAADVIVLKLLKAGGIAQTLKIAHIAEGFGVTCMMGCMLESKIGVSAAAALAASLPIVTRIDLDAPMLHAADVLQGGGVLCTGGPVLTLQGSLPGLGIKTLQGFTPSLT